MLRERRGGSCRDDAEAGLRQDRRPRPRPIAARRRLLAPLVALLVATLGMWPGTPAALPIERAFAQGSLPATVVDHTGQPVTVTSIERIVSLNGDITETVDALGLAGNLVGVDSSSTYPESLATLPRAGDQAADDRRGASGTQLAAGADTGAAVLIEAAGGTNAGAEAGLVGYQPLTPEAVVAANPDVLLLLTAGLESVGGVDGMLQIGALAQTPAGQQRRVVAMDDLYLLGLGPRTPLAIRDLQDAIHPALRTATP